MGYIDGAVESGIRVAEEIGSRMQVPNKPFPNEIAKPSPVFGRKAVQSSNSRGIMFGALIAGTMFGVLGFYCYKTLS